jgi:hypothetical protein
MGAYRRGLTAHVIHSTLRYRCTQTPPCVSCIVYRVLCIVHCDYTTSSGAIPQWISPCSWADQRGPAFSKASTLVYNYLDVGNCSTFSTCFEQGLSYWSPLLICRICPLTWAGTAAPDRLWRSTVILQMGRGRRVRTPLRGAGLPLGKDVAVGRRG